MIRRVSRRRTRSHSRQAKKSGDSKEKPFSRDIRQYVTLKISSDRLSREPSPPMPEVSVPSPDAAALPKPSQSTCQPTIIYLSCPEKGRNKDLDHKTILPKCNGLTSLSCDKDDDRSSSLTHLISTSFMKENFKKKDANVKNHQVTEYFSVRRSNRKPLCNIKKERQKIIEDSILSGKEDGLEVREFPNKGRGVISKKSFKRNDFVIEYAGELISYDEAKKREAAYALKSSVGCYMYYFKYGNKQYCIDATTESSRKGRLINHSKRGNLKTQSFVLDGEPHLIFVASQDISAGEELLYDYGDRSKRALEFHPWLAM